MIWETSSSINVMLILSPGLSFFRSSLYAWQPECLLPLNISGGWMACLLCAVIWAFLFWLFVLAESCFIGSTALWVSFF